MYSSRSDRIPSTCKPVEIAVHPGGVLGDGGGSICGRVHSRHSNPRFRVACAAPQAVPLPEGACMMSRLCSRHPCEPTRAGVGQAASIEPW
eukprot:5884935-Prymnesium_polylepis.1